jgi:4-amino-4-deoxychorismate lyase
MLRALGVPDDDARQWHQWMRTAYRTGSRPCYGDGLFETIRFVGQRCAAVVAGICNGSKSCERLRMPAPDPEQLWHRSATVSGQSAQSVVRITVTRGVGERGYALPASPQRRASWRLSLCPVYGASIYSMACACILPDRLADQPLLAGMKHLNRLEQVLARAEWNDPAIGEGLLCDQHGHGSISATMANLFAVVDGVPVTPSLDRCGVAGVARAEVLALCPTANRDLSIAECLRASEVFLSSSVRGILPVQAVGDTVYAPGPVTRACNSIGTIWDFRWSRHEPQDECKGRVMCACC